jgi:hypothetical protein
MLRHPHYLDIPWEMHWRREPHGHHERLWWWVMAATLLAMFFAGGGVLGGA